MTLTRPALAKTLVGAVLSTVIGVVIGLYGMPKAQAAEPSNASPAPQSAAALFDARYPDASGQTEALAKYRGKPVVVNFWASWCGPCVREMPALSELHEKYRPLGVPFIGIGVDNAANIAAFLKRVPVHYPIYVAGGGGADLARNLGNPVGGLPYTVLINAQGQIAWSKLGTLDAAQLAQAIDRLPAKR